VFHCQAETTECALACMNPRRSGGASGFILGSEVRPGPRNKPHHRSTRTVGPQHLSALLGKVQHALERLRRVSESHGQPAASPSAYGNRHKCSGFRPTPTGERSEGRPFRPSLHLGPSLDQWRCGFCGNSEAGDGCAGYPTYDTGTHTYDASANLSMARATALVARGSPAASVADSGVRGCGGGAKTASHGHENGGDEGNDRREATAWKESESRVVIASMWWSRPVGRPGSCHSDQPARFSASDRISSS